MFAVVWSYLSLKTPRTPLLAGLKALDWFGCLTIVGGTVMLLLGLNFGGSLYVRIFGVNFPSFGPIFES